jgi:hypothetical protein
MDAVDQQQQRQQQHCAQHLCSHPPPILLTMAAHGKKLTLAQRRVRTQMPWIEAAKMPFRDDAVMVGPPSCTAADFKAPRLRRCPFDPDTLRWEAGIDAGLDGCVWKVHFGDKGPFILKVVRGNCWT